MECGARPYGTPMMPSGLQNLDVSFLSPLAPHPPTSTPITGCVQYPGDAHRHEVFRGLRGFLGTLCSQVCQDSAASQGTPRIQGELHGQGEQSL